MPRLFGHLLNWKLNYSIKHLFILTALSAISTAILISYQSVYGTQAVLESLTAGFVLLLHGFFIFVLAWSFWNSIRIPRIISASGICIEIIGFCFLFGAFGIIGFVIAMSVLMIISISSVWIGCWIFDAVANQQPRTSQ